jgi:hypothetical protein
MFEKIEDITITWEEDGIEKVKELDKAVLTKGAWSTIMFLYQDWEPAKQQLSAPKVSIRRYRKLRGSFQQQSKFNISSKKQAENIIEVLQKWYK